MADALRRGLVDEEVSRVCLRVGVPGQHADAAFTRFLEDGRNTLLVLDAHRDDVNLARDPTFDDFGLLDRVEVGRAVPDQVNAKFARGLFGALAATDEIRIAFGFRHHRDGRAFDAAG